MPSGHDVAHGVVVESSVRESVLSYPQSVGKKNALTIAQRGNAILLDSRMHARGDPTIYPPLSAYAMEGRADLGNRA
ncbi:hypothetical protein C9I57_03230 [Trinickia symbiotica]|uniref:Uncharacterized protein n=1 Tax=Trinickia symbiotica TaxID=863227 RepID=A0A2T3Y1X1_9BURK|nr:hypothetical protein C9I57_03230 [Trinickia symbiotica]